MAPLFVRPVGRSTRKGPLFEVLGRGCSGPRRFPCVRYGRTIRHQPLSRSVQHHVQGRCTPTVLRERANERARSLSRTVLSEITTELGVYLFLVVKGGLWSSLSFQFDLSTMNEGSGQRHTSSTTIASRAFTFDRASNRILARYGDPVLCPVLVAGPRPAERSS